jgi:hypothetical protein
MKFKTIFDPHLYSVIFEENTDEFEKFLRFLTDATELENERTQWDTKTIRKLE